MESLAETYAQIVNDVLMTEEHRPYSFETSAGTVTGPGIMQISGWMVTTLVCIKKEKVYFTVEVEGKWNSYSACLNIADVDEYTIQDYAEEALDTLLEENGWSEGR